MRAHYAQALIEGLSVAALSDAALETTAAKIADELVDACHLHHVPGLAAEAELRGGAALRSGELIPGAHVAPEDVARRLAGAEEHLVPGALVLPQHCEVSARLLVELIPRLVRRQKPIVPVPLLRVPAERLRRPALGAGERGPAHEPRRAARAALPPPGYQILPRSPTEGLPADSFLLREALPHQLLQAGRGLENGSKDGLAGRLPGLHHRQELGPGVLYGRGRRGRDRQLLQGVDVDLRLSAVCRRGMVDVQGGDRARVVQAARRRPVLHRPAARRAGAPVGAPPRSSAA
mmetsp:Transcript_69033/g.195689  ORF Transcript_69033/g.195689 Transcript_69033/m.195689 type:complete len:291 (+) Transcript_69033:222-1094(+)